MTRHRVWRCRVAAAEASGDDARVSGPDVAEATAGDRRRSRPRARPPEGRGQCGGGPPQPRRFSWVVGAHRTPLSGARPSSAARPLGSPFVSSSPRSWRGSPLLLIAAMSGVRRSSPSASARAHGFASFTAVRHALGAVCWSPVVAVSTGAPRSRTERGRPAGGGAPAGLGVGGPSAVARSCSSRSADDDGRNAGFIPAVHGLHPDPSPGSCSASGEGRWVWSAPSWASPGCTC